VKIRQKFAGLVLTALAGAVAADSPTIEIRHSIRVQVFGALEGHGTIISSLFDSPESYMRESIVSTSVAVDGDGKAYIDMGAHPPGEYAVAVVYDENNNGSLDTGFLKIPTEKTGFSNNASARFGPPKWRKVRFTVVDKDVDVEVYLGRKTPDDYSD
jgi:uncharacterized protein (DUF2141 family)